MTHWQHNYYRPEGRVKKGERREAATTQRERLLNDTDRFRDSSTGGGRGFAGMAEDERKRVASLGGKTAHAEGKAHQFTPEEARAAALKGVQARRDKGSLPPGPTLTVTNVDVLNQAFGIGRPTEPPPPPPPEEPKVEWDWRKRHEFNGKAQTLTEWAHELGMNLNVLKARVNTYGWTIERALTQPRRRRIGPRVWVQLELPLENPNG